MKYFYNPKYSFSVLYKLPIWVLGALVIVFIGFPLFILTLGWFHPLHMLGDLFEWCTN